MHHPVVLTAVIMNQNITFSLDTCLNWRHEEVNASTAVIRHNGESSFLL